MNTHTRSIKNGDQFGKVIPLSKNRKVFLGSGDTFTSLQQMRKIIFKTLNETEKLAKQLEGKSVKGTVKNIKEFIYWHIQYLQDETEQLLHSPAHTWSIRSTGVDCKSYSIFASSILTNLGIANSLRQIKQVAYNPEYWSHVYVVLPNNNLVIDGTVNYDHEPMFAEKYDEPILEAGLKGLGQLAYACNWCDHNKTTSTFHNNSQTGNSQRGSGITRGGARLPFTNLANLLADTGTNQSTEQVRDHSGDSLDSSFRLRLAKAKAKARKRKILLLNI